MNRKEWIRGEITAWQRDGLIENEVAEKLLGRYAENENRISWGTMLAGAIGALMIGLGIIAFFAANWDHLGRVVRTILAILPVLVCGVIALVATKKEVATMSLWEPLGIFWTIAIGAAACLIAQTYQVGGSAPGFILLVALLTLPIAWITQSVAVMSLWPIFGTVWGMVTKDVAGSSLFAVVIALAIMALSLPNYIAFLKRKRSRASLVTGQLLTGLVYSLGPSILIVCTMRHINMDNGIVVFWIFSAIIAFVGIFLKLPVWPMIGTLVATGAAFPTAFDGDFFVLSLLLSIAIAVVGVRKTLLSYTNIGAALFLWLVLSKFFSSSIDFSVKGLVFIIAGFALTALNVVMVKNKKERKAK